jgi:ParB family protein of integrating conjugative element (PFGI_1 class)
MNGMNVPKFRMPLGIKPSQMPGVPSATDKPDNTSKLAASRALLAASALSVKAPGAGEDMAPLNSQSLVQSVPVMEIECYEKNPRLDPNERADEIKQSIRISGLDSIFQVTKIPGRTLWVVAKGANTRLKIVQELWLETQDPRFERIQVQIVPWRGHAAAIADHVKENTLRADMSYWDKAKACLSIQQELLHEGGKLLNVSELTKVLNNEYGFIVDRANLSRYLHVAEHFEAISRSVNAPVAKALVPSTNALIRLAAKFNITESDIWQDLHAALERYAQRIAEGATSFDVDACLLELNQSVALRLNLTDHQLRFALSALEHQPEASQEDLLASAVPPASSVVRDRHSSQETQHDLALADEDDGPDVGADDEQKLELSTARHSTAAIDDAGLDAAVQQAALSRPKALPVAAAPATAEIAIQQVMAAAAAFSEACYITQWLVTSPHLPYGYFMEVVDTEMATGVEKLTQPVPGCADARVRVGAWWLAASLNMQWDPANVVLLPATSRWRQIWGGEDARMTLPTEGNTFDIVQHYLGGVASETGTVACHVEYIGAVMEDPQRALRWFELCSALQQLRAVRERQV